MKFFRRLLFWLRARENQADLAEEMELHRQMLGDARSMGNLTRAREDARAVWIWPWLESVLQDLRYAIRGLRRQPSFAAVAILALGCAIGLNTSFFTVFEAIALRPWPVKDARHIVRIFSLNTHHMDSPGFSVPEFHYLRDHAHSLSGMLAMQGMAVHFGFEPFGGVTHVIFVDADHFRVLGINMARGRGFLPDENRVEAPERVVVLSFAMWRDHFGSDPEIVGKTVRVEQVPFTVVGVAPEEFLGTSQGREDAWFPIAALLQIYPAEKWARNAVTSPKATSVLLAGRLTPGVADRRARAELETLSRQFHAQFALDPVRIVFGPTTMMAAQPGGNSALPVFALMFAGVTLIVLLACANVGNLLIARAAARRFEIGVRRALGAGRARIVRQLMTESLLLALGAAALGTALAYWLPTMIVGRFGEAPPLVLTPDLAVLGYALALAIVCCMSFGLAPALHGTRVKEARARLPLRSVLLAAQVAMSVVLLTGAALLLEGVRHSRTRDPGFSFRDVTVVSVELPAASYDRVRIRDFSAHLSSELYARPDLRPVAVVSEEPWSNSVWSLEVRLPGEDRSADRSITALEVSPEYFKLLRIPLVAGRDFTPADTANKTILINQTMAHLYWGDANPIGKSVVFENSQVEVVGVAQDNYSFALDHVEPLIYQPFGTSPFGPKVLVRSETPGAAESVTAIVQQLDMRARTLAIPLSENMERSATPARIGAQLAALLGIFALALATIGMSGVFGYMVRQRNKEIGIRMALGATPREVIALVLSGTSRAVLAGLAAGFLAAIAMARLLTTFLYGVSPFDPRAYAAVAIVLALAGLTAAFWPARRATKIDPMTALRCE
jgi:predicted permease